MIGGFRLSSLMNFGFGRSRGVPAHPSTMSPVQTHGEIAYRGRPYLVGRAFAGSPVALRPRADGVFDVYYCAYRVARIDLTISADRE